jgi:hypothetical protein
MTEHTVYDPLGLAMNRNGNSIQYINNGMTAAAFKSFNALIWKASTPSSILMKVLRDEYAFRASGLYNLMRYLGYGDNVINKLRSDPKAFLAKLHTIAFSKELMMSIINFHVAAESGASVDERPSLSHAYYITNAQLVAQALYKQPKDNTWVANNLIPIGLPVPIQCTCCSSRRKMDDILSDEMEQAKLAITGTADPAYIKHVEACSPLRLSAFGWGRLVFWRVKNSKIPNRTGYTSRILCNACYMRATRAPEDFLKFIKAATGPIPDLSIEIPDTDDAPEPETVGERNPHDLPANINEGPTIKMPRESTLIKICIDLSAHDLIEEYTRKGSGEKAMRLIYSRGDTYEALQIVHGYGDEDGE